MSDTDKSIEFQLRNLGTNESVNITLQNEGAIVFDKETKALFVDGVQFGFFNSVFVQEHLILLMN